ncbi:MAG: carboxylesterase family protein [Muribaculaceae bacterium]|nr:carboxylesterase family protein [Muribaculaceae bacterium]
MKIQQLAKAAAVAIAAALWGCAGNGSYDHPVVATTGGHVQGFIDDSVAVFKGIPYAAAERFMPPHEHEKWDTVMLCTEFGDIAPQPPVQSSSCYIPTDTLAHMGEDCLNLNIWTSTRSATSERPVMVWLHGGAFDYGSSRQHLTFDGASLARTDDVVVVTLNHRLNVFGFLDLSAYGPEYAASGNLGMLDILQALKWLKNNIAAFGGDPDNITLFGHGSGGVKVMTLMAMPCARGYYHKVIIQSGTLEGMYQPQDMSRRIAALTIEEAKASGPDELAKIPFDTLWYASRRAIGRLRAEHPEAASGDIKFAPVVDGNILPRPIFSDSAVNVDADVPVIIGSTFAELTTRNLLQNPDCPDVPHIYSMTDDEVEAEFNKRYGAKKDDVELAFAMAYPDRPIRELLMMDTKVRSLVLRIAHMFAQRRDAPVYVYLFSWVSPVNDGSAMSFRCSELPFMFNNYELAEFSRAGGADARRLSRIMSRCWTSFARSGNPNNSITPFWRRINLGYGYTMIFDSETHLETYPDLRLMQLLEPENVKDIELNNE